MDGLLRFDGATPRDSNIDVWLDLQPGELGTIAREWYTQFRDCGADIREMMHDGCPTVCVEDVPFGYVGVYKAHVNVGFFYGAELNDPPGLMEGSGKRMRHVKLRPGIKREYLSLIALIDAAYSDVKTRL